jgi:hypothetical protein
MRLSRVVPALLIFAVASGAIAYKYGLLDFWLKPITVAVIDTGVDVGALGSHLSTEPGYNFFDNNNDVKDENGHGTRVATLLAQSCSGCKILPIKISKNGSATRADDIAKAIRYALLKQARVINLSMGVTDNSPDLEASVLEAKSKNVVVVTAAGTGIHNPFRPEELAAVYPQGLAAVIVVGVARSLENTDMLMNHGDELDVVVTGQPSETFASSHAAASVSGAIARKIKGPFQYSPDELRAMLRSSSTAPNLKSGTAFNAALSRIGFGAFSESDFLEATVKNMTHRVYRDDFGGAQIEISAVNPIESIKTELICADKSMPSRAVVKMTVLKKGRGRVVIERLEPEFSISNCSCVVTANFQGGSTEKFEEKFIR